MSNAINKLGIISLSTLIIGNTIGAGIFMLPISLAKIGSISILSWLFTSCGALLFAFVFAKMSKIIHYKNGGPYAYASLCFGDFTGFQIGFTFWVALWIGNCSLVITIISYATQSFYFLSTPIISSVLGLIIIWLMALINILGINRVAQTQLITTIIKLLPIILIIIIGLTHFHVAYIANNFNISNKSNFSAFSYAAMLTLWAYTGQETACIPTCSTLNPKKDIKIATIISTVLLIILYVGSSVAIMGLFSPNTLMQTSSPFADAATILLGKFGNIFTTICIIISCLGALNSGILIESQLPMAIAEDNLFPKIFQKRNKKNVPGWGVAIDATLMSIFILLTKNTNLNEQFQLIITVASVTTLIAYLYSAIAEIILISKLKKEGVNDSYNKINILIAIFASIYAFWAIFGSGIKIVFYIAMLFFASSILYAYFHWQKNIVTIEKQV